jgi:4-amino-4-deoxy-L-arabinose transferase-like glycosyltransferase
MTDETPEPEAAPAPSPEPPAEPEAPDSGEERALEIAKQGRHRPWLLSIAAVVSLASLLGPISKSGIWDPPELRTAELARRIALNLLGGKHLVIGGGLNSVPTLGELARGQLPFTSVAVGFRLFGLHDWAGRLPLALWGLVGLIATYALVARLVDRAAGAFAVIALATTPLYFLHARTMLGDIVTMSSIAIAVAGLGVATFDRRAPGESPRGVRRGLWFVVGLAGMAAGFGARGVLIGVAIPALGVGLAWLIGWTSAGRRHELLGDACGGLSLVIGAVALGLGIKALLHAQSHTSEFSMLLGAAVDKYHQRPTFDYVIMYLGHALYPWSAVVPFAFGRLLRAPTGVRGAAREREVGLRLVVLVVSAVAFCIYGVMAPTVGHIPFGAVFALAAAAAIVMRDFERGAPGSRTFAMGVAAMAVMLYLDFKEIPNKGLSAYGVEGAAFPESFHNKGDLIILVSTAIFLFLFFYSFMEREKDAHRRFDRDEYLAWPREFKTLWSGNLMFWSLVAEAALAGLAGLAWLSHNHFHWRQFAVMGALERQIAYVSWIALPVVVMVLPEAAMLVRDVFRVLYDKLPVTRATVGVLSVAGAGLAMSLIYYPTLATQISPKQVFEEYSKVAGPGQGLGLLGVGSGSASYYAGRQVPTFNNITTAFDWLTQTSKRRWLVIRSSDLPRINSLYREKTHPSENVPVLDAHSSEILLVSNELLPGEKNKNPFDPWISSKRPHPSHPLNGQFGNKLDALGWDITTPDGGVVDSVEPGKQYVFKLYYEVVAPISGEWKTFIHVDGYQRRFNGDHDTLEGKYPFNLWRVGDYITDIHPFVIEPNFTPGMYNVYYGLFIGERRLEVTRGAQNDNRLDAGVLRIR